MKTGFTLIELLLVIALIAILGASASPLLSRFVLQTNFDSTTDMFVGAVTKAQGYAMDGKNGAVWGVCKSGSEIRVFSGSCNSPTFVESQVIPASISVSDFLSTTFNKRGEPSQAITVQMSSSIESLSVVVNAAGGINVQ